MKAKVIRGVWIKNKAYGPPAIVELTPQEFAQLKAANKVVAYTEPPAPPPRPQPPPQPDRPILHASHGSTATVQEASAQASSMHKSKQ